MMKTYKILAPVGLRDCCILEISGHYAGSHRSWSTIEARLGAKVAWWKKVLEFLGFDVWGRA